MAALSGNIMSASRPDRYTHRLSGRRGDGSGGRQEQLALGRRPTWRPASKDSPLPIRVISDMTHQLVQGYFTCDDCGLHSLKGVETPTQVYRVWGKAPPRVGSTWLEPPG